MSDSGRGRSDRRHRARATVVLAMLAALTAACQREIGQDAQDEGTAPPSASAEPISGSSFEAPVAVAPLTRADLLAAANGAADAVASGRVLPAANLKLKDRAFVLRLPFGCNGEQPGDWAGWTYDSKSKVLRLSARPERWRDEPWVRALAGDLSFEWAEGFWIERPWSSAETCPPFAQREATSPAQPPASLPRQTLGLAQFFAQGAPRTLQRGARPYAITLKAPELNPPEIRGFALTISGRIVGFADGQPVHCLSEDPALAPRCLIAAEFAEIAFEDPQTGTVIANWNR
jgi:hypothetical protein